LNPRKNKEKNVIKETLKRIIDGNSDIPNRAKEDLKIIIESGYQPE